MKNLKDFISVKKSIPDNVCDELLKNIKEQKWEKHKWYGGEKDYVSLTKDALVKNALQKEQDILMPFIQKTLFEYQKDKQFKDTNELRAPFCEKISPIRFNEYGKHKTMAPHYDNIKDLFDGVHKGVPQISIVGILNNGFKGGKFLIRDEEIKLKKGDILLFPSSFLYPHTVTEVTTKTPRYSFVCWGF
jgi:predicted 2-oxoglutarate/Fe(II)-dependent dioxygenase YbiX|tara:strand:+ start:79 stop:645 length:567 start_codon:yes stop_codon:yes gene_type:complete